MSFPAFFDAVPHIRLHDPLAEFLGAAEGGVLSYTYHDVVKLAGHSCPTVASAYNLTRLSLKALYGDELAERGGLRVALHGGEGDGVTGVVANVASYLTGAVGVGGFKGLGGRFVRRELLRFGADVPLALRFTRQATGQHADAVAHLQQVPADPAIGPLLTACMAGAASPAEQARFAALWQDRVRRILIEHGDDPAVFEVRATA